MNTSKVTRFEVIDHSKDVESIGRVFSKHNCSLQLSLQDEGRTLKVFLN